MTTPSRQQTADRRATDLGHSFEGEIRIGGHHASAGRDGRMVYVQAASDSTQHSKVADAASDLLHEVFGAAGVHTRTSVGVRSLPKNAAVELDMIVATSAP